MSYVSAGDKGAGTPNIRFAKKSMEMAGPGIEGVPGCSTEGGDAMSDCGHYVRSNGVCTVCGHK
jgi:hypothetical protein